MVNVRYRRILNDRSAKASYFLCRAVRLITPVKGADLRVERFSYPQGKLLAAPVPKVASRTIKETFSTLNAAGVQFESECEPSEIRSTFPDYFVFSFVRNPWARIHSCWKDKVADAVTLGKISILSRFEGLRPFMPFEEFVEWLDSEYGRDEIADRHWLSQVRHLSDSSGAAVCDFVGRLEEFERGLAEIERLTGISLPRVEERNTKGNRSDYRQAFNERSRRIIERRYGQDIEAFGYQFA